jgi:hypothetical protein
LAGTVQIESGVGGVAVGVGRRDADEGISDPHGPARCSPSFEDGAHGDRRAASPNSGFDQVAADVVSKYIVDTSVHDVEAKPADHTVGGDGPVSAVLPPLGGIGRGFLRPDPSRVAVNGVKHATLH